MSDLWQADEAATLHRASTQSAPNLPTTFQQGFDAAFSEGRLFGQSIAGENARGDALQDHIADIKQKTGKDIAGEIDWSGFSFGGAPTTDMLREQVNATAKKLGQPELSADELEQAAVAKSRASQASYAELAKQESTTGGKIGMFLGGVASSATDPINLLALPIAPETEGVSILAAALRWGAVGAGAQVAIEAAGAPYKEEVQPGYNASGQPLANVGGAFLGGAALGGVTKALGNAWTRVQTGAWPQSVRDAGNVVASHANIMDSNVYLGAEGEAAHWEAMNFSVQNILDGKPVDVTEIITPQLEAQSRNLMVRLEGERATSLPIFDERSIRLTSEEAGLRQRAVALGENLESLPEGNATSADRLNRLQAVDQQIANASTPELKKALGQRRDQILVDTTPEKLRAETAPLEERRVAQSEQASIAARLDEIANERAKIQGDNLATSGMRAAIGQAEPIRGVPLEAIRAHAAEATTTAEAERAATPGDELPFQATAAEGHAQASTEALASGVQQISRKAGYAMPSDEAATIAERLKKATPEEAQDTMRDLQVSPRQVADAPTKPPKAPETIEPILVEPHEKVTQSPEYEQAMRADIDRDRMTNDRGIPVDVDKDGEPIYRSVDSAMEEVDGYKAAADHIQACAAPAAENEAA